LFLLLSKCLFIFTSTSTECCSIVSAQLWHPTRHFVTLLHSTASIIQNAANRWSGCRIWDSLPLFWMEVQWGRTEFYVNCNNLT
jgi:hypothetical protein